MAYNRHNGVPRNLAYDSEDSPYYSTRKEETLSYVRSSSSTIFAGENQTTLFLVALAYARYKDLPPLELKKRESNISTDALKESGNWLIRATGLADTKDLMALKDEGPIYKEAEKYANAGFKEIKELITKHGRGFSEILEIELKRLAEEFIDEERASEEREAEERAENEALAELE